MDGSKSKSGGVLSDSAVVVVAVFVLEVSPEVVLLPLADSKKQKRFKLDLTF